MMSVLGRNEKGPACMGVDASGNIVNLLTGSGGEMASMSDPMLDAESWPQLDAPGVTTAYDTENKHRTHTFQYTVATINGSVDVRAEGSVDGVNYFNLDPTGDTRQPANGVYFMSFAEICARYVRFRMVSEGGGTDVTVDAAYLGGN